MVNEILLNILIRKIQKGEISMEDIKREDYKAEVLKIVNLTTDEV